MESPQRPEHRPKPGTFEHTLAQVGRALDEMAIAAATAAEQIGALKARTAELERQAADLDTRFTKILEERFKQAEPNAPTPEIQRRYDLADELKSVFRAIDQELRQIYFRALNEQPGDEERAGQLAVFVNALLGNGDLARVEAELQQRGLETQAHQRLAALVDQVNALRLRAGELDPAHEFVFRSNPGSIDESFQKAWMHCDPDGEIEFVVTPAYVVEPRVFLHQEVFTKPHQPHADTGATPEDTPAG